MSEALNTRGIYRSVKIDALSLLCKYDRNIEYTSYDCCDAYAGSFDGENLVNGLAVESTLPLQGHFLKQSHIHLMVEERVNFKDITALNDAVALDSLFEQTHRASSFLVPVGTGFGVVYKDVVSLTHFSFVLWQGGAFCWEDWHYFVSFG